MRSYRLFFIAIVTAIACLAQTGAVGGPMGDGDQSVLFVVAPLPDSGNAIAAEPMPLAVNAEPTQRSEHEARASGERKRMVASYLILRGLQGAGPLFGGR